MSITSLISPQLPLLRRYARAVSGSQASGDNHVVAMLESLLADPASFDRSLDPRVAAYRLFSRIWNANPMNQVEAPPAAVTGPAGEKEPWNGEFYVSYGGDPARVWEEARQHGFISAGGGTWYSQTLKLLSPGDR